MAGGWKESVTKQRRDALTTFVRTFVFFPIRRIHKQDGFGCTGIALYCGRLNSSKKPGCDSLSIQT